MTSILLLVALAQVAAPAAPYVTATTAVKTFYVDPTGRDTNACTASGRSACATVNGALAKLPFSIQHAQTVNIAAGTYSETIVLSKQLLAALTFTGAALTNVTPTTGTATGSVTSASGVVPHTITDSTQTWTTDNFIGRFMVMTSGAASGQIRPIATNTATTLTLAGPFTTTPSAADTYAIQTPAVTITTLSTTTTFVARLLGIGPGSTDGRVTFTNINFESLQASGIACDFAGGGNSIFQLTSSRCVTGGGSSSIGIAWRGGGTLASTGAVFSGGQALQLNTNGGSQPVGGGCRLQLNSHLINGTAVSGSGAISWESPMTCQLSLGTGGMTVQANAFAPWLMQGQMWGTPASSQLVLRCNNTGMTGLITGLASVYPILPVRVQLGTLYVIGCETGVNITDPAGLMSVTTRFDCGRVSGACVKVSDGARMQLPTTWNTDAGTDISIDGTSYTKANLTGATPTRLPSLAPSLTGSSVWQ